MKKEIIVSGQKFVFKDVKGYTKRQHFAPLVGENVVVYVRGNNTYCFIVREDHVIFSKGLLYHFHNESDGALFSVTRSMFDRFCTVLNEEDKRCLK